MQVNIDLTSIKTAAERQQLIDADVLARQNPNYHARCHCQKTMTFIQNILISWCNYANGDSQNSANIELDLSMLDQEDKDLIINPMAAKGYQVIIEPNMLRISVL